MSYYWIPTGFKGIRYREHPTRKHGMQPDRYFNARYSVKGKAIDESYGWASEKMSASKAFNLMCELKEELRAGTGTGKLADRQKAKQAEIERNEQENREETRKVITYAQFFKREYLAKLQDKKPTTGDRELGLHKLWILPALGRTPIRNIGRLHILKVKSNMTKAGRSPRSVQYAFACIRMVMTNAIESEYYHGVNPIKALPRANKPKFDNRRTRFLSHEEADQLLQALKLKSQDVHDMTLLSLHCGLRAGEIFGLIGGDVDVTHSLVSIRDTKSGKDRTVNMTEQVNNMFKTKTTKKHSDLVFPAKNRKKRVRISKTFERVVDDLDLNEGVADRKQKLTFHSCRHTCASWLAQAGVSLFVIKEILGHANIDMTMRYSHLSPDGMKAAVNVMEKSLQESRVARKENVVNIR